MEKLYLSCDNDELEFTLRQENDRLCGELGLLVTAVYLDYHVYLTGMQSPRVTSYTQNAIASVSKVDSKKLFFNFTGKDIYNYTLF